MTSPRSTCHGKALPPIRVGNAPVGIAVTPDGSTVFVTNLNSESVTPITVSSDTPGASIATAGGPVAVVVAHNDAWVVNTPAGGEGNNLQPISVASGVAGKPIKLPNGAQNVAVLPSGNTAWVVCLNTDKLVAVNLVTHKVGAAVKIRGGPFAVAVAYQAARCGPDDDNGSQVQEAGEEEGDDYHGLRVAQPASASAAPAPAGSQRMAPKR